MVAATIELKLKEERDLALTESNAQTTAMREALVGEILQPTAEMFQYTNKVE